MHTKRLLIGLAFSVIGGAACAATYSVVDKWPLGGDGGWDLLSVDVGAHLLYLSRASHVSIVDTLSGKIVGDIADTPGVHGIAIAPESGRGFISVGKADQVKVFDLHTRAVIASVAVGAKPDAILYEPETRRVFVFNGHGGSASVINAADNALVKTLALGGDPELGRSDGRGHVYVNLEDKNELAAIDVATLVVTAHWPLTGCDGPTGLALDAAHHRSFSVCSNSTMVVLDTEHGRVGRDFAHRPRGRRRRIRCRLARRLQLQRRGHAHRGARIGPRALHRDANADHRQGSPHDRSRRRHSPAVPAYRELRAAAARRRRTRMRRPPILTDSFVVWSSPATGAK